MWLDFIVYNRAARCGVHQAHILTRLLELAPLVYNCVKLKHKIFTTYHLPVVRPSSNVSYYWSYKKLHMIIVQCASQKRCVSRLQVTVICVLAVLRAGLSYTDRCYPFVNWNIFVLVCARSRQQLSFSNLMRSKWRFWTISCWDEVFDVVNGPGHSHMDTVYSCYLFYQKILPSRM